MPHPPQSPPLDTDSPIHRVPMSSPISTSPGSPERNGATRLAAALDLPLPRIASGSSVLSEAPLSASPVRPAMPARVMSHYGTVNRDQPSDNHRRPPFQLPRSGLALTTNAASVTPPSLQSDAASQDTSAEMPPVDDVEVLDISDVGLHAGDQAPQGVTPSASSPALSTPGLPDENGNAKQTIPFEWGGSPMLAHKEHIVPWAYMDDRRPARSGSVGPATSRSLSRNRTLYQEHANQFDSAPRYASANATPTKSLAIDAPAPSLGHQRITSTANGRSSSLSASGTPVFSSAPGSNKKLKNPFSFLRKRSSHLLRESDLSAAGNAPGQSFDHQRKASAVSASSRYSSPPPSANVSRPGSSSHSPSMAFFSGRGSMEGSLSSAHLPGSTTKSRPHSKGAEPHSLGIDEEQEYAEAISAGNIHLATSRDRKKRLGRPVTRDKDTRGGGPHDDFMGLNIVPISGIGPSSSDPSAVSPKGTSSDAGNGRGEVEMKLDMNFDQIDDIIDPTVNSNIANVGPKDERLIEGSLGQQQPGASNLLESRHRPGGVSPDTPFGAAKPHLTEVTTTRGPARDVSLPSVTSDQRGSSPSAPRSGLHHVDLGKAGLRKISFAEVQKLSQWDGKIEARGRRASAVGPSEQGDNSPRTPGPFSATAMQASRWNALDAAIGNEAEVTVRELRKASAISRTSARSGVSPKSSAVNLTLPASTELSETTAHWSKQGFADPNYEFPPYAAGGTPVDLSTRKGSSGSSGAAANAASSWAAPDSWAVQTDKAEDAHEEDDSSGNDSEEAEQTLRSPQQSRKGSILSLGWSRQSVSSAGAAMGLSRSRDGSSGGDADTASNHPMTSSASTPGGVPNSDLAYIREHSSVEALTPVVDDENTASPSIVSPMNSRGGAIATAVNGNPAVANAAVNPTLNRIGRQKSVARPSTSGSSGAAHPVTALVRTSMSPAVEESDAPTASNNVSTKRPALVAQTNNLNSSLTRNYIMRIDTPFGTRTVSIPLLTSTSELRAIIARKFHSGAGAGAYRLFVRDKGSERPLGESEKPALLQRRRMEQAGYTEADGLDTLGREDHSYLLKFVFRPDSVPNFDSESFGNTEDRYQHLDLSNRNIEMVPIFVYRHADWINFLDLSANPMTDLPSDFIQLCTNLRTLRLSALTLKRVPQSIRTSSTLTHLDLSNNRIPDLNHIALDQIPQLRSLKIQNNRLADLPPYFAHLKALKQLNLSNNRFEVFPPVICELPALSDLDMSFNSIPSVDPQLGNLKQLESLVLVSNSLDSLPEEFSGLSSLRKIDIRRNAIQDVSALFRLENLSEAQLQHNSIKSLDAMLTSNMRNINLGHNPLSKMTIGTSARSHLINLDLSAANLSRLDDDLVGHLHALRDLNLDNNQFVSLPETLGQLTELRTLKCTNNNLASLPDSIGSLSNLRLLLVHNNNLKYLPSSIWQCGKLHTINASSNLLDTFPLPPLSTESRDSDPSTRQGDTLVVPAVANSSAAYGESNGSRRGSTSSLIVTVSPTSTKKAPPLVSALKKLRLADNRLTHDVLDVLGFFVEAEVLNVSFNEIYEVPHMSLAKLTKLRELYLSGNNLSSLPTDDLVHMKRLCILHINANRLLTLPAELGQLNDLANLDVGNNILKYNIANWQFDWNWNSNPGLRYLNLSGNKRLEIKSKASGLSGSGLKPDASNFQRLANLRVLSLIDVTVLLQTMPDENDNRRVRTSLSHINNMSYGMSDALGRFDNLNLVDVVIPQFRKDPKQCIFGLFEGRGHSLQTGSRIARFLSDWVQSRLNREVMESFPLREEDENADDLKMSDPDMVATFIRRAFLRLQQEYALLLMSEATRKAMEAKAAAALDSSKASAPAIAASNAKTQWQAGAAGIIVYINHRTLYCANVGDALAVLSRGGTAEAISNRHNPLDRPGTERIRASEGWVSLRGYVNDVLDVSRSFGYFHLNPMVTATPTVRHIELEDSDEFVIVASRALWDHMSFQTAVDIARTEKNDPMIAAQKLRDFAISYGAEESIMVMIVAVGDLFESRHTPSGTVDSSIDYFRKAHRRDRAADLPGDRTLARLEREVAPPVGQVALVFTDIKNSTSLWETNGGMHSAMRLHNILLRRQLRTVGGYEVKTEGDAFMVSFPTVTSALLWCFNCQLALLREDWPQEILESEDGKEVLDAAGDVIYRGLSVRMGVHWGRPVCEADPVTRRMDYFGPMVNRSARVSGAADGGQIMASRDFISELTGLLSAFDEAGGSAQTDLDESSLDVEESSMHLLPSSIRRDVVLLRRMGFGISEVGERKLKGFEMAETLNLVYPKALAGRMATREDAPAPQVFEPTLSLLSIDEIKALGMVCLRLESLSNAQLFPGFIVDAAGEGTNAMIAHLMSDAASIASASTLKPIPAAIAGENSASTSLSIVPASGRRRLVEEYLASRSDMLLITVRDDATDEELAAVLQQLVTRTCNALAMIMIRCQISCVGGETPAVDMQDIAALINPFRDLL